MKILTPEQINEIEPAYEQNGIHPVAALYLPSLASRVFSAQPCLPLPPPQPPAAPEPGAGRTPPQYGPM